MKTLIFVFTGEFGYELLNWQGVIRKFKSITGNEYRFIVASRGDLSLLYEFCDQYIDISKYPEYQNGISSMYRSTSNNEILKNNILNEIDIKDNVQFVFSSNACCVRGLNFGSGGIYENLPLENNLYIKICPPNMNLDVDTEIPYILIQTAQRPMYTRSQHSCECNKILNSILENEPNTRIINMIYKSSRPTDTENMGLNCNFVNYNVKSFAEQIHLINKARKCIFFTEGDFRSHNYIPPFVGKNVHSIAHESVYTLGSSPIDFWNKNVFKFGGQIIKHSINSNLTTNKDLYDAFIKELL